MDMKVINCKIKMKAFRNASTFTQDPMLKQQSLMSRQQRPTMDKPDSVQDLAAVEKLYLMMTLINPQQTANI
jgi:hypothetical protein